MSQSQTDDDTLKIFDAVYDAGVRGEEGPAGCWKEYAEKDLASLRVSKNQQTAKRRNNNWVVIIYLVVVG